MNEEYDEIRIPQQKLRIVGNTYVITVPRRIVEEHGLKEKKKYSYKILVRRNHMKKDKNDNEFDLDNY